MKAKTKVLYGCAIYRHDGSYVVIGPLESNKEKIESACEALEPDGPKGEVRKIYNVAKIEIELK